MHERAHKITVDFLEKCIHRYLSDVFCAHIKTVMFTKSIEQKYMSMILAAYFPHLTCEEWVKKFIFMINRQLSEIELRGSNLVHTEKCTSYMLTKMCQMCFIRYKYDIK